MLTARFLAISQTDPEESVIQQAAETLTKNGLVVAPTETRYGLLARADSRTALERLFDAKGRDESLPTSVFVRGQEELSSFGCLSPVAQRLIDRFLPGPLTLVVCAKGTWEPQVVVNKRIGLRWSTSRVISRILEDTDFPITATSANLSGGRELDTAQQIAATLGDAVELYLDAGELKGVTSTVVDCSGESLRILRAGAIPASEIAECLKDLKWK